MNEQVWRLYECTYNQFLPICSNRLIARFATANLAKSSLPTKNWNQIGDTIETEPEVIESNSAKLKYYSIKSWYEDKCL